MSSIRPLATITLLAFAGIFLYMKINETEPALPPELGEYADFGVGMGVDVGSGDLAAPYDASADPFQYSAPATSQAAEPYAPAAVQHQSSTPSGNASDYQAPAYEAPAYAPPATDQVESSPVARSASEAPVTPEMPDLPPLAGQGGYAATSNASPSYPPLAGDHAAVAAATPAADTPAEQTATSEATIADAAPTNESATEPPAAASAGPASYAAPPATETPAAHPFASAKIAVQAALDRGELSRALLMLTDWYGDPSLSPDEKEQVENLLSQLAGSVIYSTESRLEPPYLVRAGESLQDIAARYQVPWQLLAKINGVAAADELQAGQRLKVVRGPFSALIDISRRELTLMLDRRYAGRFAIEVDPDTTVEEGQWTVDQKLLTPSGGGLYGPSTPSEDRKLVLTSPAVTSGQIAVLRGPQATDPVSVEPRGRTIRLKSAEVADIYDILSVGSKVVIRR